jgi:WD40 repeat protein
MLSHLFGGQGRDAEWARWSWPLPALKTKGEVRSVSVRPDGKALVTASGGKQDANDKIVEDSLVVVWDLETALARDSLTFKERAVAAAVSPDGKTLAVALWHPQDNRFAVELWDVPARKRVATLSDHGAPPGVLRFNAAGTEVVVADADYRLGTVPSPPGKQTKQGPPPGKAYVWDVATGKRRSGWWDQLPPAAAVAVSPTGQIEAVAVLRGEPASSKDGEGRGHTVEIWTAGAAKPRLLKRTYRQLLLVAFSPDGKKVLCVPHPQTQDGGAELWDVVTGQKIANRANGDFRAAAFSPDGRYLLWSEFTGPPGKRFAVLDADTLKTVGYLRTKDGPALLAFSPDGRMLVTAEEEIVRRWGAAGSVAGGMVPPALRLEGHTQPVRAVALTAGGTRVVAVGARDLLVWDADSGKQRVVRKNQEQPGAPRDNPLFAGLSPDGTTYAQVQGTKAEKGVAFVVSTHDVESGMQVVKLAGDVGWHPGMLPVPHGGSSEWFAMVHFAADGKTLATVSHRDLLAIPEDKDAGGPAFRVTLWDAGTGKVKGELRYTDKSGQYPGEEPRIAFDGNSHLLTAALRTHKPVGLPLGKENNRDLIEEAELKLWDGDGMLVGTIHQRKARPGVVALSSDGKVIALASGEGLLLIDVAEKKERPLNTTALD